MLLASTALELVIGAIDCANVKDAKVVLGGKLHGDCDRLWLGSRRERLLECDSSWGGVLELLL